MPRPLGFGVVYTGFGRNASGVRDAVWNQSRRLDDGLAALEAPATINIVLHVGCPERPLAFSSVQKGPWSAAQRILRIDVPIPVEWTPEDVDERFFALVLEALNLAKDVLLKKGIDPNVEQLQDLVASVVAA